MSPSEPDGMTLEVAVRLDLARILLARNQISPVFRDTPQYECEPLVRRWGAASS